MGHQDTVPPKVKRHEKQLVALADCAKATLGTYYAGKARASSVRRIERALRQLGLDEFIRPPSDPDPRRSEVS